MSVNTASHQPYLHQWHIDHFNELPIQNSKRRPTDICCIVLFAIFSLAILIASIVLWNGSALHSTHLPTDSQGIICADTNYPFLYYDNNQRVCLASCPQLGIIPSCLNACKVGYYSNTPFINSIGSFCLPTDQSARNLLLSNSGAVPQWNYYVSIKYIFIGVGIAFLLSTILALSLYFLTMVTIRITLILSILALFGLAILLFCTSPFPLSILAAIICIILPIIMIAHLCKYSNQLTVSVPFLQEAGSMLKCSIFTAMPLFIMLSLLYASLMVFEYYALLSSNPITTDPSQAYSSQSISSLQSVTLLIQGIWGFSLIRDACTDTRHIDYYTIGAWTVQAYCNKTYSCILSCTHFGSIVSGSFLHAFFYIPSLFVSLLCPASDQCLCNTLSLVRPQAYSYIYMTGNSYCQAVRQCEYLAKRSTITQVHESVIDLYAFGAHLLVAGCTLLVVVAVADTQIVEQAPNTLFIAVACSAFYVASYVIDMQIYVAEALTLCYLAGNDLEEKSMAKSPQRLKNAFD